MIFSKEQAAKFRNMVMASGSDALTPIAKLIREVEVDITLRESRGWLHILHAITPWVPSWAFRSISIHVRAGNHKRRLTSPYWDIPKSRCAPAAAPAYRVLHLLEAHFTSLGDISHFLSNFPLLTDLYLHGVTWADDTLRLAPPRFPHGARQVQRSPYRINVDHCRANTRLLLQVIDLYRIPTFQALRRVDREAVVNIIKSFSTAHDGSPGSWPANRPIRCVFTRKQTSICWAASSPDIVCPRLSSSPSHSGYCRRSR